MKELSRQREANKRVNGGAEQHRQEEREGLCITKSGSSCDTARLRAAPKAADEGCIAALAYLDTSIVSPRDQSLFSRPGCCSSSNKY